MKAYGGTVAGFRKGEKNDKKWTALIVLVDDERWTGKICKEIFAYDNNDVYENVEVNSNIVFIETHKQNEETKEWKTFYNDIKIIK